MRATIRVLFCSFVAAALAGCGGGAVKTESVVGVVTLEGAPLADAMVNFTPAVQGQGSPSYGKTDAEGRYKLQTLLGAADAGTTPGEYLVTISKSVLKETGKMNTSSEGKSIPETKPRELLPARYTDAKASGLKATVGKGGNKIDFDLKSS